MQSFTLHPYIQEESNLDSSITVECAVESSLIRLNFHIPQGIEFEDGEDLSQRRDELWRSTCFECFIAYEDRSYDEWNFDLHGHWQNYRFETYRYPHPPQEGPFSGQEVEYLLKGRQLYLELPIEKKVEAINPCVVIEGKQFFAHRHGSEKADFHDLKTFINLKSIENR